jgi:CO/xanthine dehydrogenase FAD-binding subunit
VSLPASTRFLIAETVSEAVAPLDGKAILLGGGTVASPRIAAGEGLDCTLVDLARVAGLAGIEATGDGLTIGATTTLEAVHLDSRIGQRCAALAAAAGSVGNPQVRRAATVGGSLALAIPLRDGTDAFGREPGFVADIVTALLVLDTGVTLHDAHGSHTRDLAELLAEGRSSGQLITRIHVPLSARRQSGYVKFAWRQSSGKTIVNVGLSVRRTGDVNAEVRVAIGGQLRNARAFTSRVREAEAVAEGVTWSVETIRRVTDTAAASIAFDDLTTRSESYRRALVRTGLETLMSQAAH